jgi:hypothetical protein
MSKPTINCFGCSFTSGIIRTENSWPEELAKLVPNYNIVNYGYAASSALFALHMMRNVKKNQGDINIFQITSPYRVTSWKKNFHMTQNLVQRTDNYWEFARMPDDIKVMTTSTFHPSAKKFHKQYYSYMSEDTLCVQFECNVELGKQYADYSFRHLGSKNDAKVSDVFQQEITEITYKNYCYDNDSHLTKEGHVFQASWVYNKIKDLL